MDSEAQWMHMVCGAEECICVWERAELNRLNTHSLSDYHYTAKKKSGKNKIKSGLFSYLFWSRNTQLDKNHVIDV